LALYKSKQLQNESNSKNDQIKEPKIINRKYLEETCNNSLQRSEMRKNIKKQQAERIRFLVIFFVVFSMILPKIFIENYNNLFLKKFVNQNIQIPKNLSFLNQAEYAIANNGDFIDTKFIDEINSKKPLMKAPVLNGKMNNLTNRLKFLSATYPQLNTGVFIWDYNTGKYVDIKADEAYPTASIIKLPVLFQLFRRSEKGLINLNDKITLENYYVTEGSGYLQYSPLGTKRDYRQLINLMIQESDNTATNMLLSSIGGMNELDREMKNWGLKVTSLSNWLPDLEGTNVSTPKEMGTILYNIGNTDLLSIKTRMQIVDIMSHVKNNRLIQAGLPAEAGFIHKTGDIGTMLGDAGVVALPDGRKYIIVIMVKRPWNSFAAKEFIIKASEITYNSYIRQNQ